MSIGDVLLGNEIDRMPNFAFHMMSFVFKLMKVFFPYEKTIDQMGIQEGMLTVGQDKYLRHNHALFNPNTNLNKPNAIKTPPEVLIIAMLFSDIFINIVA